MMMFSEQSIIVREICNGIMTVSSVFLLVVLAAYIARWSRRMVYTKWYKDFAIQGAFAVAVMITGHAIRAGGSWIEFFYLGNGWSNDAFVNTVEFFVVATFFIVSGKLLIIWFFSERWRLHLTATVLIVSVTIPLIVAALAQW